MKMYPKTIANIDPLLLFCSLYCLSIPFYAFRIHTPIGSLGITSFLSIILICILLITKQKTYTQIKERILWILSGFFLLSFIPSLILHSSHHAVGVFLEWLFLPIALCFLLYKQCLHKSHLLHHLHKSLFWSMLVVIIISMIYIFLDNFTYDGRLSAFFLSPNHLAMYITPILMTSFPFIFTSCSQYNIPMIVVICISSIVLLLTQSLTTIIIYAFISGVYFTYLYSRRLYIPLAIIGLSVIMCIFGIYLKITHSPILQEHNSFTSRMVIWDSASYLIQKSPLFGYTVDAFQEHYLLAQTHYEPYPEWAVPTPHNIYLTLLFSGGFFTLTLFLLICSRVFFISLHTCTFSEKRINIIFPLTILMILLTGIFDTPIWKNDLAHIFWIIVILGISYNTQQK